MIVGTVIQRVNIRSGLPGRTRKNKAGTLEYGDKVQIVKALYGEKLEHNNIWYQLESGDYVWSGGIRVDVALKPEHKKVIFTADDYGVVDSLNQGMIKAVQKGQLRSVTCLTNYPGKVTANGVSVPGSLDNIRQLLTETNGIEGLELGVHLTISSGSPILGRNKVPLLCRSQESADELAREGYTEADFQDYSKIRSHYVALSPANKRLFLDQLEQELKAQIEVFTNPKNGPPIALNHITSHHNSLLFHDDFFAVMKKIAVDFKTMIKGELFPTPMRSLNNLPHIKDNLYMLTMGGVLGNTLHLAGLRKILAENPSVAVHTPDLLHSNHYGPLPGTSFDRMAFNNLVLEKVQKSRGMLEDLIKSGSEQTMEFLLHLRDGEPYEDQEKYKVETLETGYAGIDYRAFDERTAELKSFLASFSNGKELYDGALQTTDWQEIRLK